MIYDLSVCRCGEWMVVCGLRTIDTVIWLFKVQCVPRRYVDVGCHEDRPI